MVIDNDNPSSDDSTSSKAPKKRSRLFGSLAPKKASDHAAQSEPGFEGAPVTSTATDAPAEQPEAVEPEQPAAVEQAVDTEPEPSPEPEPQSKPEPQPEPTTETETETEPEPEPESKPAFPVLKPESTTSLLFFAPPVSALPPLPPRSGAGSRGPRDDDDSDEQGSTTSRRRSRGRGRSGASTDHDGADAPRESQRESEPRQPRQRRAPEPITEPQRIKGSTRLEAKKQRRRDGRDAGRRRPVVTEAEFLARRESVDRVMVVRSKDGRIQLGVLEDEVLVEHYVARSSESSLIGNVYLGKVQNVLPSMEAAFVDIGRGRNAVLYSGEVDWEAAAEAGEKNQPRRIELALKPGDKVLVQVTKDPIGHKGARLTSQVSLPGRYLVYVPNGSMSGISRKLPDTERARLKKILKEVLPENVGVIVRTAAEGATEEQLTLDVQRLTSQWAHISEQVQKAQAPTLLHSEPDLLIKIIRDVFNEDFRSLVIHGADAYETITTYLRSVAPDLLDRVVQHAGDVDPFDEHRINEQIEKALERKVWLPSGGSLVIDRTEAMTVVDVNTGKFVGSGGNLEETVTKNNLEAAEEIVRQLRLRDIGGIIVVDFIDMVLESNRDLVLRRLMECLSRDRTKHQVAEVTSLGLVQMTRKRLGLGLLETFSETCDVCAGRGLIVHHDPVAKHRAPSDSNQNGGNRRRGGNGNSGSSNGSSNRGASTAKGSVGTHAITDDVSRALATIAAKTVHHENAPTGAITLPVTADAPATDAPAESPAASSAPAETEAPAEQKSGGRRGRRGSSRAAAPVAAATENSPAPAETVDLFDIPVVTKPARQRAAIDPDAAQQLLGSVLESLPEPPAPGTRKRASRRVTSGPITAQGSDDDS